MISSHFITGGRKDEDGLTLTIEYYAKSEILKICINTRNTVLNYFEYKLS